MRPIANPCAGGYPSPYGPAPHVGALPKIDVDKALDLAVKKLTPTVEKYANDALKNIGKGLSWVWDKIECTIDPAKCRWRERKEKYIKLANALLAESKKAGDAKDYVTAYAFAEAASNLDTQPPFLDWFSRMPGGSSVKIGVEVKADAMALGYRKNAEAQAKAGKGGTHKPGGLPEWLPYAAGAAALLIFFAGRR